jgi:hypothetical protein
MMRININMEVIMYTDFLVAGLAFAQKVIIIELFKIPPGAPLRLKFQVRQVAVPAA